MLKPKFLIPAAALTYLIRREYIHGLEYLYSLSLCRGDKAFLFNCNNISAELSALDKIRPEFDAIKKWSAEAPLETFYLGSENGKIYLRYFKQRNKSRRYVIALHGYGCDGRSMLFCAKKFYEAGFNVLIPDLPCHGKSYGKFIGMGQYEYKDIIKTAKKITAEDKSAEIMLYGVSMGAAVVLAATAAEDLPENVRCVVSDCSFSDAKSILAFQLKNIFHFPPDFIIHDLDRIYRKKSGLSLKGADIKKFVSRSAVPTLFIHGSADGIVPAETVFKLYNAANCPKDILIVNGAGHGVSAYTDIPLYWGKVLDFADRYFTC